MGKIKNNMFLVWLEKKYNFSSFKLFIIYFLAKLIFIFKRKIK